MTTSDNAPLPQIVDRLAGAALTGPLTALDAATLTTLIASSPAARDQALATLAGRSTNEDPSWLTDGPLDPDRLALALAALDRLADATDATSRPHLEAMRAWTLWALHRPTQALTTLHATTPTRLGKLLERAIAVHPAPTWKETTP